MSKVAGRGAAAARTGRKENGNIIDGSEQSSSSKQSKEAILTIKEATGASDEEITAMLEQTNYDINETVYKLVANPFVPVTTKMQKKKQRDEERKKEAPRVTEVRRQPSGGGRGRGPGRGDERRLDRPSGRGYGRGPSRPVGIGEGLQPAADAPAAQVASDWSDIDPTPAAPSPGSRPGFSRAPGQTSGAPVTGGVPHPEPIRPSGAGHSGTMADLFKRPPAPVASISSPDAASKTAPSTNLQQEQTPAAANGTTGHASSDTSHSPLEPPSTSGGPDPTALQEAYSAQQLPDAGPAAVSAVLAETAPIPPHVPSLGLSSSQPGVSLAQSDGLGGMPSSSLGGVAVPAPRRQSFQNDAVAASPASSGWNAAPAPTSAPAPASSLASSLGSGYLSGQQQQLAQPADGAGGSGAADAAAALSLPTASSGGLAPAASEASHLHQAPPQQQQHHHQQHQQQAAQQARLQPPALPKPSEDVRLQFGSFDIGGHEAPGFGRAAAYDAAPGAASAVSEQATAAPQSSGMLDATAAYKQQDYGSQAPQYGHAAQQQHYSAFAAPSRAPQAQPAAAAVAAVGKPALGGSAAGQQQQQYGQYGMPGAYHQQEGYAYPQYAHSQLHPEPQTVSEQPTSAAPPAAKHAGQQGYDSQPYQQQQGLPPQQAQQAGGYSSKTNEYQAAASKYGGAQQQPASHSQAPPASQPHQTSAVGSAAPATAASSGVTAAASVAPASGGHGGPPSSMPYGQPGMMQPAMQHYSYPHQQYPGYIPPAGYGYNHAYAYYPQQGGSYGPGQANASYYPAPAATHAKYQGYNASGYGMGSTAYDETGYSAQADNADSALSYAPGQSASAAQAHSGLHSGAHQTGTGHLPREGQAYGGYGVGGGQGHGQAGYQGSFGGGQQGQYGGYGNQYGVPYNQGGHQGTAGAAGQGSSYKLQ